MSIPMMGGVDARQLARLKVALDEDIEAGRYSGAIVMVARHGEVVFQHAVGSRRSDDATPLRPDSVISLFSMTKAFTNVLTFQAIERGRLALTTKVSDVIPEFAGKPRVDITIEHLLTHRTGLPGVFAPRPGDYIDVLEEVIQGICKYVHGMEEPGLNVSYSPFAAHALLGELVRRTDPSGRRYRQIVQDEILTPLAMKDTAVGVRADLRDRHVVPEMPAAFAATHPGHSNYGPHGAFQEEDAEMPWVGLISTAPDVMRFAECLRRGGELDGVRIVGPRILDMATRNRTGEQPNQLYKALALSRGWKPYPAYIGLGFSMRGEQVCQHQFGTLATSRAFGNHGAGSTLFWVDPELEMTFVALTTRLLDEADNILRFQRLSDMAIAAAT